MKLKNKLFVSYLAFLVVYSAFILLPKPLAVTLKQYHLSVAGSRLLDLTIIVILAIIWFVGFYSYAQLKGYWQMIHHDKDGKAVARIGQGVLWLVMWLPVSSTVSAILNYIALKQPKFMSGAVIIDNYLNLLLPLIAFILISLGVRGLMLLAKLQPHYGTTQVLVILLIYIGLIYYHLVATTHDRSQVYHLPIWLILTTIVAPYLYMWLTGLYAAYQLYLYQRKVKGIVYRQSWYLLAVGLCWLLVTSMGFQYLATLTTHLRQLSIYGILAVIYAALVVLAIGFVLIAFGVRRLRMLEEA